MDALDYLCDKEITPICTRCGSILPPTIDRAEALEELRNLMVKTANYAMIIHNEADALLDELVPPDKWQKRRNDDIFTC